MDLTANISSLEVDKLKKPATIKKVTRNVEQANAKTATGENTEIFQPSDFYENDYDASEERNNNQAAYSSPDNISDVGALIETGAMEAEEENQKIQRQKAQRCASAYLGTSKLT